MAIRGAFSLSGALGRMPKPVVQWVRLAATALGALSFAHRARSCTKCAVVLSEVRGGFKSSSMAPCRCRGWGWSAGGYEGFGETSAEAKFTLNATGGQLIESIIMICSHA
jgi:hypothetical protein